jgi:sterol regulatory element-binding transcription factor 1
LSKAKSCNVKGGDLKWAFNGSAYKFLLAHHFNYESPTKSLFSTVTNEADPIAHVVKDYRENLIEKAIRCLVGFSGSGKAENAKERTPNPREVHVKKEESSGSENESENFLKSSTTIAKVLGYTQQIGETMTGGGKLLKFAEILGEERKCEDPVAFWWSSLLSVAGYWLLGEEKMAHFQANESGEDEKTRNEL